jgi:hypothetical protein
MTVTRLTRAVLLILITFGLPACNRQRRTRVPTGLVGRRAILDKELPACDQGDAAACERACIALGPDTTCTRACDAGRGAGCFELGEDARLHLNRPGDGSRTGLVMRPPVDALAMLGKACDLGYSPGCAAAGSMRFTSQFATQGTVSDEAEKILQRGCALDKEAAGINDSRWRSCLRLGVVLAAKGDQTGASDAIVRARTISASAGRAFSVIPPNRLAPSPQQGKGRDFQAQIVRGYFQDCYVHADALGKPLAEDTLLALIDRYADYVGPMGLELLGPEAVATFLLAYDDLERAVRTGLAPVAANNKDTSSIQDRVFNGAHGLDSKLMFKWGTENTVAFGDWATIIDPPPPPGTPNSWEELPPKDDTRIWVRKSPERPQLTLVIKTFTNPAEVRAGDSMVSCAVKNILAGAGLSGRRTNFGQVRAVAVPAAKGGTKIAACIDNNQLVHFAEGVGTAPGSPMRGLTFTKAWAVLAESTGDLTAGENRRAIVEMLESLQQQNVIMLHQDAMTD